METNYSNNFQQPVQQSVAPGSNPTLSSVSAPTPSASPVNFAPNPDAVSIPPTEPKDNNAEKKVKIMSLMVIIVLVVNVLSFAALFIFGGNNTQSAGENLSTTTNMLEHYYDTANEALEIDISLNTIKPTDSYSSVSYQITGEIENVSDEKIAQAEVHVEILDKDGNVIDTDSIYFSDLEDGDTYEVSETVYVDADEVPDDIRITKALALYASDIEPDYEYEGN